MSNTTQVQVQLEGLLEKIFEARKQANIHKEHVDTLLQDNEMLLQTMSADSTYIRSLETKIDDLKAQFKNGVKPNG